MTIDVSITINYKNYPINVSRKILQAFLRLAVPVGACQLLNISASGHPNKLVEF